MKCPLAHLDGAYVLGALSPAERLDYEEHLPSCATCREALGELAGLSGLLSRVDPSDVERLEAELPPTPPTVLPALIGVARAQRRRRRLVLSVAAAAGAVLIAGTGFLLGSHQTPVQAPVPAAAVTAPMAQIGQRVVTAQLGLASVGWGTRLDLTCSYVEGGTGDDYLEPSYSLYVRTNTGQVQQVASWRALPGKTMHLSGATATGAADIAAVEVRDADGTVVLRLDA